MIKHPNPQGKGLVPVLADLAASRSIISPPPKFMEQISNELFTSLFVLHSRFHFKPVVNKPYWLYRRGNLFQLSMISPREWGGACFGQYVGECVLQADVTWSLALDAVAARDQELMAMIEARRREFEQVLDDVDEVGQALPFYLEGLPFYQRVFASALANSLGISMVKSGIHALNYRQAQKRLAAG